MENKEINQEQEKLEPITDESFTTFYRQLGYRDEQIYPEWDGSMMDNEQPSKFIKKFNLKDSDIKIILKAIANSATHHRSSQKSMMDSRNASVIPPSDIEAENKVFRDSEALLQTRQSHMEEVSNIAEIIAIGLGLNEGLAKATGLGHDIGHTWNGHTGERILSSIARLKNCGYIVHNAMGPYVMERENIIEGAIVKQVKQLNPKVDEKELKEFMRYVIDGIVSHNGEGVVGKIIPKDKTAEEMITEIRKCFTQKGFDRTIMPATLEGAIIRFADIIAYTRSDIMDGFRMKLANGNKILTEFDEPYLEIIGTLLAKENNYNKLLTLDYKFSLELYGLSKKIFELEEQVKNANNPDVQLELDRTKKEKEIIETKYKEFCELKVQYAQEYIDKIENKSEIKSDITNLMQNVFIKDVIEASKGKDYITMTPLIRKTLFALRNLNSRRIVPYTRKAFEVEHLPRAANQLVDLCSAVIKKSGIAYKAIHPDIKEKYGITANEEEQKKEIDRIEIGGDQYDLERKMIHYYTSLSPEKVDEIYINALEAVKDITHHDVRIALEKEQYDGELKEAYIMTKIIPIMQRIGLMGKTSETMTTEDIQKLENELVEERSADIEKMVADKMAIEYIGGMTDNTIISYLLSKNIVTSKQIAEGYGRPPEGSLGKDPGLQDLQKTFEKIDGMIVPDNPKEISL